MTGSRLLSSMPDLPKPKGYEEAFREFSERNGPAYGYVVDFGDGHTVSCFSRNLASAIDGTMTNLREEGWEPPKWWQFWRRRERHIILRS